MNFSQIMTDRVLPVVTVLMTIGCLGLTVLFASMHNVGAAISTATLFALGVIAIRHDIKRLMTK